MTLCSVIRRVRDVNDGSRKSKSYHFKRPDPPNPHLKFTFHSLDVVQLNALPPTSSRWFPPEQEEFLGHSNGITVCKVVAFDVGTQPCECDTANDRFIWFSSSMTPPIIVIKPAGKLCQYSVRKVISGRDLPRSQHFNEMLLCCSWLFTFPKS